MDADGKPKGFAFVKIDTKTGMKARRASPPSCPDSSQLTVCEACSGVPQTPRGGSGGGVGHLDGRVQRLRAAWRFSNSALSVRKVG